MHGILIETFICHAFACREAGKFHVPSSAIRYFPRSYSNFISQPLISIVCPVILNPIKFFLNITSYFKSCPVFWSPLISNPIQYFHFPNQKFQILSSSFNSCSVISNHVHEFKVPASLSSTVSSNLTINFHFLPSILLTYCTHFFESCHTVQYIHITYSLRTVSHSTYVLFHIRHFITCQYFRPF